MRLAIIDTFETNGRFYWRVLNQGGLFGRKQCTYANSEGESFDSEELARESARESAKEYGFTHWRGYEDDTSTRYKLL